MAFGKEYTNYFGRKYAKTEKELSRQHLKHILATGGFLGLKPPISGGGGFEDLFKDEQRENVRLSELNDKGLQMLSISPMMASFPELIQMADYTISTFIYTGKGGEINTNKPKF